jgi:hypothetical protein
MSHNAAHGMREPVAKERTGFNMRQVHRRLLSGLVVLPCHKVFIHKYLQNCLENDSSFDFGTDIAGSSWA